MLSNITSSGSAFIRLWFAWEAPSMSTTTRPLRVSLCKTRRERTQQDRARNKELLQPSRDPRRKKVCVTRRVTETVVYCGSYLWPGIPQPYNWVNATGGQEAVTGMRLETIHNRLVSLQHSNKVGGFFLPDEEGAVIRPTDYVLCIARVKGAETGDHSSEPKLVSSRHENLRWLLSSVGCPSLCLRIQIKLCVLVPSIPRICFQPQMAFW